MRASWRRFAKISTCTASEHGVCDSAFLARYLGRGLWIHRECRSCLPQKDLLPRRVLFSSRSHREHATAHGNGSRSRDASAHMVDCRTLLPDVSVPSRRLFHPFWSLGYLLLHLFEDSARLAGIGFRVGHSLSDTLALGRTRMGACSRFGRSYTLFGPGSAEKRERHKSLFHPLFYSDRSCGCCDDRSLLHHLRSACFRDRNARQIPGSALLDRLLFRSVCLYSCNLRRQKTSTLSTR